MILGLSLLTLLTGCNNRSKADGPLEYLLVKFDGDDNWSLLNDKGEVVKRNELQSRRTPTMVTDGIFIAERGYYKVDDLQTPIFADKKLFSGTEFSDGMAIVIKDLGESLHFDIINTKGEEASKYGISADVFATKPEHGFFYTRDGNKRIVMSVKGVTETPEGNVILGPNRTGALFYKQDENGNKLYDRKTYRAYEGAIPQAEEIWETQDDLINFEECHEMGYLVKQTEDGHAVFLDLDLKELFSHPDAYVGKGHFSSGHALHNYIAYLGDKVIYCNSNLLTGQYGVMKTDGTVLLKPEFSKIAYLSDGIFLAKKSTDEYAYMIRENGEAVTDEPINFDATEAGVLCELKPRLGKYFILFNKEHELVFIDAQGNKLELPGKLTYGCLGNGRAMAEAHRRSNYKFRND